MYKLDKMGMVHITRKPIRMESGIVLLVQQNVIEEMIEKDKELANLTFESGVNTA